MNQCFGLVASLENTAIRALSGKGKVVNEMTVAFEPEEELKPLPCQEVVAGLEAASLCQWLHRALVAPGFGSNASK